MFKAYLPPTNNLKTTSLYKMLLSRTEECSRIVAEAAEVTEKEKFLPIMTIQWSFSKTFKLTNNQS